MYSNVAGGLPFRSFIAGATLGEPIFSACGIDFSSCAAAKKGSKVNKVRIRNFIASQFYKAVEDSGECGRISPLPLCDIPGTGVSRDNSRDDSLTERIDVVLVGRAGKSLDLFDVKVNLGSQIKFPHEDPNSFVANNTCELWSTKFYVRVDNNLFVVRAVSCYGDFTGEPVKLSWKRSSQVDSDHFPNSYFPPASLRSGL